LTELEAKHSIALEKLSDLEKELREKGSEARNSDLEKSQLLKKVSDLEAELV
jgi:hypothetical protein